MTPSTPLGPGPERWARLKTIFHGALDQPAHQRQQWLRGAIGDDAELRSEAEALLLAHDTAGGFLEEPAQIDLGPAEAGPHVQQAGPHDPGARIGPYLILEEIGRGGMGIVYLAEDVRLGRRVAIKSLPQAVAGDAGRRERLRREARAAATISHPGVAVVYALEEIDDQLLLVTEYVPGRTLREEMSSRPLDPARAIDVITAIVRALSAAHEAGVIHRDLKPENVIITHGGAIKVVDFGIAYIEGSGATRHTIEGALVGTPAYMAPEQLAGSRGDARADLYAAGIVLAEMLTGRPPLSSGDASTAVPAPPAPLAQIVARCLSPDPAGRFGSARDMLHALDKASRGDLVLDDDAPPRTPARWWWEFHQGAAALIYWLLMLPAWTARGLIGGTAGRAFFIAALAAVIVAANLRLHLWFTSRFYPGELAWLRRRTATWIHVADWIFGAALIAGALLVGEDRSPLAIVLLSFGIGAAVAFLVIEPATTRAAFRDHNPRSA